MGFKILTAVRKAMFALYKKPLSPLKDTLRTLSLTSFAPSLFSSFAKTPSKPKSVVATILKSLFISVEFIAKIHLK